CVCLIPTLMAIIVYNNAHTPSIQSSEVSALTWEGPGGSSRQFWVKEEDGKDFISFLLNLNGNATPIDGLPKDTDTDKGYKATFVTAGVRSVYRYYFSTVSPSNSYMVDSEKNVYRIKAADTIDFLDSEHSADLYPASAVPTLTVVGETLNASSVNWTYYTYSGTGRTLTQQNSEIPTYTASYVGITLSVSRIPDSSLLVITDDSNQVLYKGSLADYNASTSLKKLIRKDTLLHFSLEADWKEQDGAKYSGKASFGFDVQTVFDPAANFWLGETSVELGEFVVLSGEFVEEVSDLSFASSPAIGFSPTFVRDGELVRALIPIPRDLAAGTGQYTFTVTCQGKEYPLTLNVTAPTHSEAIKTYNYSQKVNTALRTEANLAEFRSLIASLPATSTLYANDRFVLNTGEGTRAKYGQIIHNTGREADQFRSNGLAFVAYTDTKITPAAGGTVVAVTTTSYGGNTVVVDHGWGLFSVYYCLGSFGEKAVVGTYVTSADVIGYGGREGKGVGYTDGITCYCETWIGGQPVSYYPLETEGIVIGTPN
ncbi:MAG: M23 family metallopeptidase, partial [Clostridia bacterium]|nr:M23 family metallopeptidase [Clostridia bacterium]